MASVVRRWSTAVVLVALAGALVAALLAGLAPAADATASFPPPGKGCEPSPPGAPCGMPDPPGNGCGVPTEPGRRVDPGPRGQACDKVPSPPPAPEPEAPPTVSSPAPPPQAPVPFVAPPPAPAVVPAAPVPPVVVPPAPVVAAPAAIPVEAPIAPVPVEAAGAPVVVGQPEVLGITESREIELAVAEDPFEPASTPETDDRSTFATGLADEVDFSPAWVAGNVGLGMLIMLLLVAAAQLFNDALKMHHDHLVNRLSTRAGAIGRARVWASGLPHPPPLVSFALVAAVLGLLADPSVAFSVVTLGQMMGMALAIAVIIGVYDGLASRSIARETGLTPRYRLYPIAIAVAFASLALSRIFDVAPGVLYGLFAGVIFAGAVDSKLHGRAYARSSLLLIAASLGAYGVHRGVSGAAAGTSPGLAVIVVDTAAAAIFIGGLQAVIVQLLPTRYVNGEKIAHWNRLAWFGLLGGALAIYLQFVVRPNEGQQSWGNLWFVLAFVAFAVGFWVWCAVGHRRRVRAGVDEATAEVAAGA